MLLSGHFALLNSVEASMHQQQIEDYDEDRGKIGRAIQKFNIKSKLLFIGKYEESNSYAYVQGWFLQVYRPKLYNLRCKSNDRITEIRKRSRFQQTRKIIGFMHGLYQRNVLERKFRIRYEN